MEQAKFKCGDTVRLKSGGPAMTVQSISGGKTLSVICVWYCVENSAFSLHEFKADMLAFCTPPSYS